MELGSTDSKKFGHKRIRWSTNSDRIAKAWNSQKTCRICENERSPVETKLILEAVKGEMLKDETFSEVDLKFAASRGTCQHQNLHVLDERKKSGGVNRSVCTTKCPDKLQYDN